jgi:hypothetical protein
MKERNQSAGRFVKRPQIASLPGIATQTSVRQILHFGRPAVLSADDVVDLMREVCVVLMQQTILAAMGGALRYETAERLFDVTRQGAGELALSRESGCARDTGTPPIHSPRPVLKSCLVF